MLAETGLQHGINNGVIKSSLLVGSGLVCAFAGSSATRNTALAAILWPAIMEWASLFIAGIAAGFWSITTRPGPKL
jgi:hypothetical protein